MSQYVLRPDATEALTGWEANPHLKLDDNVNESNTDALSATAEYVASSTAGDTFEVSFPSQSISGENVDSVMMNSSFGGLSECSGCAVTNNLMSGAIFVGGSSPTTYAGHALAVDSPGYNDATDGGPRGIRVQAALE